MSTLSDFVSGFSQLLTSVSLAASFFDENSHLLQVNNVLWEQLAWQQDNEVKTCNKTFRELQIQVIILCKFTISSSKFHTVIYFTLHLIHFCSKFSPLKSN